MSSKISARDIVGTPVVLGRKLRIERIAWQDSDGLSFDVYDDATDACLTMNESFDDYPESEQLEDVVRGSRDDTAECFRCGKPVGTDGHLVGAAAAGDNPWCCNDCWDERLS